MNTKKIEFTVNGVYYSGIMYIVNDPLKTDRICINHISVPETVKTVTLPAMSPDGVPIKTYKKYILGKYTWIEEVSISERFFPEIETYMIARHASSYVDLKKCTIKILNTNNEVIRTISIGDYIYESIWFNPKYCTKYSSIIDGAHIEYRIRHMDGEDFAEIERCDQSRISGVYSYPINISMINGMKSKFNKNCEISYPSIGIQILKLRPDAFESSSFKGICSKLKINKFTDLKEIILPESQYSKVVDGIYHTKSTVLDYNTIPIDTSDCIMKKMEDQNNYMLPLIKRGIILKFVNDNGDIVNTVDFTDRCFNIDWIIQHSPIKIEKNNEYYVAYISDRLDNKEYFSVTDILNIGRWVDNPKDVNSDPREFIVRRRLRFVSEGTYLTSVWSGYQVDKYVEIPEMPGLFIHTMRYPTDDAPICFKRIEALLSNIEIENISKIEFPFADAEESAENIRIQLNADIHELRRVINYLDDFPEIAESYTFNKEDVVRINYWLKLLKKKLEE